VGEGDKKCWGKRGNLIKSDIAVLQLERCKKSCHGEVVSQAPEKKSPLRKGSNVQRKRRRKTRRKGEAGCRLA